MTHGAILYLMTMEYIIESGRIYATNATGKLLAEVTFPTQNGISTINHTFVDSTLRGQGIAGELVKLAADQIVGAGNQIVATCPYAVTWFQHHPEYRVTVAI